MRLRSVRRSLLCVQRQPHKKPCLSNRRRMSLDKKRPQICSFRCCMFGACVHVCVIVADGVHDVLLPLHTFVAQACRVGRN